MANCKPLCPARIIAPSFNCWLTSQIFPERDRCNSSWMICVPLCPQHQKLEKNYENFTFYLIRTIPTRSKIQDRCNSGRIIHTGSKFIHAGSKFVCLLFHYPKDFIYTGSSIRVKIIRLNPPLSWFSLFEIICTGSKYMKVEPSKWLIPKNKNVRLRIS